MNKSIKTAALIALLVAGAAALTAIYCVPVTFSADKACNALWKDAAVCAATAACAFALAQLGGCTARLRQVKGDAAAKLKWCLPCLAVAAVNFPLSALIAGGAVIERADLIWLFLLKCLAIAACEELLFRGLVLELCEQLTAGRCRTPLAAILISSAAFGLFHLFNLLAGAGAAQTALQAGYTFLTGIMYAFTAVRTGSILPAIALHALYDAGGLIISDLGSGSPHDAAFWVLTAAAAALCAAHLTAYTIKNFIRKK